MRPFAGEVVLAAQRRRVDFVTGYVWAFVGDSTPADHRLLWNRLMHALTGNGDVFGWLYVLRRTNSGRGLWPLPWPLNNWANGQWLQFDMVNGLPSLVTLTPLDELTNDEYHLYYPADSRETIRVTSEAEQVYPGSPLSFGNVSDIVEDDSATEVSIVVDPPDSAVTSHEIVVFLRTDIPRVVTVDRNMTICDVWCLFDWAPPLQAFWNGREVDSEADLDSRGVRDGDVLVFDPLTASRVFQDESLNLYFWQGSASGGEPAASGHTPGPSPHDVFDATLGYD